MNRVTKYERLRNYEHDTSRFMRFVCSYIFVFRNFILLILLSATTSYSQDIHFSQYYASPLSINPAQTGMFDGFIRVGGNYRMQWRSVTIPYQTSSVYLDLNPFQDQMKSGDMVGLGVSLFNDRAGNGILSTNKYNFSFAYHKSLNRNHSAYLSFGGAMAFVEKKIDFTKLSFDNQWNDIGFDMGIDPNEPTTGNKLDFMDAQVGMNFTYFFEDRFSMIIGSSVSHLNNPPESFYGDENTIYKRYISHALLEIKTGDLTKLQPGAYYTTQRGATEMIIGSNLLYTLNDDHDEFTQLYFGAWTRPVDAFYLLAGIEFNRVRTLLNYDFNYSKLLPGSRSRGAIEISVVYVYKKPTRYKPVRFCPRF